MSSVKFELPDADRRHPRIWWGLALFFGLLILVQLAGYLGRKPGTGEGIAVADQAIRQHFLSRAVAASIGTQVSADRSGLLAQATDALVLTKGSDPEAALRWAIVMTEEGRPIGADALAVLGRQTEPRWRAIATIYRSQALPVREATRISAALSDSELIDRVVAAHARLKSGDVGAADRVVSPVRAAAALAIMGLGALALIASLVLWAVYVQGRSVGRFVPAGWPGWPMSLPDADRRAALALGAMVLFSVAPAIPAILLRNSVSIVVVGAIGLGIAIAGIASLLGRPVFGRVLGADSILGPRRPVGRLVGWGVSAAIANIPIQIILLIIGTTVFRFLPPPEHPLGTELSQNPTTAVILGFFASAVIGAPIMEELLFRGFLAPAIAAVRRSVPVGIVVSSLLFAAMHPTGIPAWPSIAGLGAMASLLTYQTGSLVPAMAMHATHNGMIMVFVLVMT